jgi:hypothetical protein
MFFSLYGKKRVAPLSPAQLLLLKQRQQYLQIQQIQLLSKANTSESKNYENKIVKDVIVYEIGLDTESQELPQPKLEEPVIEELNNSVVGETREAREARERRETREIKEKEKPKKRVKFAEDEKK